MARPALAADRAVQVIDLLVSHPTQRFTLTEIVRQTNINPASAHALVHVLLSGGYLDRHEGHKTYGLGPALIAAGTVALGQQPAVQQAIAELEPLSIELGVETVLTSRTGSHILVVARSAHTSAFGPGMDIGQRIPVHPPIGAVFLAFESDAEIESWLDRPRMPLTEADRRAHREALERVRTHRYAVTLDSTIRRSLPEALARLSDANDVSPFEDAVGRLAQVPYQLGEIDENGRYDVNLVAVPVFDSFSRPVAAISAVGFPPQLRGADLRRIAEVLRDRAAVVTKRSQGRLPADAA